MLEQVKDLLGITGSFQDSTIEGYISEVKEYMLDAGVQQSVVESKTSVGCIARGVEDLWTAEPGNAKYSDYFMQRVIQLRAKEPLLQDEEVIDNEEL